MTLDNETKEIRNLKFSPNGKFILLATRQNLIMLMDAFNGTIIKRFEGNFSGVNTNDHMLLQHSTYIESGFSPDSKYVISGSANTS